MALCGNDGVEKALISHYDLVFTDLGMPDISGWEVASSILEKKPELLIVLVTGWGATLDENEVRSNGVRAVIHKPFDIDQLTKTTGELLQSIQRRTA